jgi:Xaa-Pro aminopeptidase
MHQEQRTRAHDLLQKKGVDRAVFARPESVTWLTGFAAPVQVGLNLFAASLPLVWYAGGQFTLIVVDAYSELAKPFGDEPDGEVVTYTGYQVDSPIEAGRFLAEVFARISTGHGSGKTGVESQFTGDLISAALRDRGAAMVAIDHWLEPLRRVKTAEEIVKLRRSFALTDVGHQAARAATIAGTREIDVWNALHSAIQASAGRRVPVGNDCVVGWRQANIGGWPEANEIHDHDSLIVDISVVLDGYWSDSCATYYAGERTSKQAKIHKTIENTLDYAISLIRPGVVAREIDSKVRQFIADAGYPVYPHHTGHGVGVSGHEAPRLTPYSEEMLTEGMVIMLEPGIYFPGETGVRLEDGMLITANGVEILSQHNKA